MTDNERLLINAVAADPISGGSPKWARSMATKTATKLMMGQPATWEAMEVAANRGWRKAARHAMKPGKDVPNSWIPQLGERGIWLARQAGWKLTRIEHLLLRAGPGREEDMVTFGHKLKSPCGAYTTGWIDYSTETYAQWVVSLAEADMRRMVK